MSVTKRLRFEILRRDGFRCRYCGKPGAETGAGLTVDHVVADALGGTDEPSNLVAACRDCNSGKSSTTTDAHTVDDIAADSVRWAAAMRTAYDKALTEMGARNTYLDTFDAAWNAWHWGDKPENTIPKPSDWAESISKWYAIGIPLEVVLDALRIAMRKDKFLKRNECPEWAYMCGVVWNMHEEMQRVARATVTGSAAPAPASHCDDGCMVHDSELDFPCTQCGQRGCLWYCGYQAGDYAGWERLRESYSFEIHRSNLLHQVCDLGGIDKAPF